MGLPALSDLLRADLSWWQEILAGRYPLPPGAAVARDHIQELAALEAALPSLVAVAPGAAGPLTHCDLRVDNLLVSAGGAGGPTGADGLSGAVWICDWNWLCWGPAWFDTAGLLVSAYASGLDADALFFGAPDGGRLLVRGAGRHAGRAVRLPARPGGCRPDRRVPAPAGAPAVERRRYAGLAGGPAGLGLRGAVLAGIRATW